MCNVTASIIKSEVWFHCAADWSAVPLGANDWPQGCVGYACNLVRPVAQGHRAQVLYPMLGSTLVFETLPYAAQYREFVTQVRCILCS